MIINIGSSDGRTIIPSSHCQTVLYWRLLDFRWYSQLGPKLRPHVGLSNITTASEGLKIIQAQPFVSVLHFKITNYLRKWILVSKKSIIVSLIVDIFKKLLLALKIMKRIVTFCWFSNSMSIHMHKQDQKNLIAGIPWFILKLTKLTVDSCSIFPHVIFIWCLSSRKAYKTTNFLK